MSNAPILYNHNYKIIRIHCISTCILVKHHYFNQRKYRNNFGNTYAVNKSSQSPLVLECTLSQFHYLWEQSSAARSKHYNIFVPPCTPLLLTMKSLLDTHNHQWKSEARPLDVLSTWPITPFVTGKQIPMLEDSRSLLNTPLTLPIL